MKTLVLALLLSVTLNFSAQAECVLSVSGGYNSQFTMSYYFSKPALKDGWVAKWDPAHAGDAVIEFNQSQSIDSGPWLGVLESATFRVNGTSEILQAKGMGFLSPGATCGQPALGKAYSRAIRRMLRQLNQVLPNCTQ